MVQGGAEAEDQAVPLLFATPLSRKKWDWLGEPARALRIRWGEGGVRV